MSIKKKITMTAFIVANTEKEKAELASTTNDQLEADFSTSWKDIEDANFIFQSCTVEDVSSD